MNFNNSDYESLIFHCLQLSLSADDLHVWDTDAKVLNNYRSFDENSTGNL